MSNYLDHVTKCVLSHLDLYGVVFPWIFPVLLVRYSTQYSFFFIFQTIDFSNVEKLVKMKTPFFELRFWIGFDDEAVAQAMSDRFGTWSGFGAEDDKKRSFDNNMAIS